METSSTVAAFLAQARARGLSHKTIDSYSWALRHITSKTLPTEAGQVETILAQAAPRLASESLYDLWRVLRTFHRWAKIRFDIPDPTSHVAPTRPAALRFCLALSRQQTFAASLRSASPSATGC